MFHAETDMNGSQEDETDQWKEVRVLGQGGFGYVYLYKNERTNEHIALKKCRKKEETHVKVWERWKMEVSIMGKLQHDNVIKAVEVPDTLKTPSGEPPVLGMEFCEGGDLRKVLNRPENCFGLKESEIRQLVSGIGSAIEYLHSHRIIHRDLKPENIVLKPIENNKVLYKIIDLGYAKELDMSSICNSFVGTQQYLAPELHVSPSYSKTVDYWSFGCLVFECISGFRPFLPTLPPVPWHKEIMKKSPDDISAEYDAKGQIKFSKELPPENQLCKPMQDYFKQWLRLMLRWDPKARGGGVTDVDGQERPKCFYTLEQILSVKIFNILHVETNAVLSCCVNHTHTIENVQKYLEKQTGIPAEEQDIILGDGNRLKPTSLALQGCSDLTTDELIVFLFRKGSLQTSEKKNRSLPASVRTIVRDTNTFLKQKEHRKAWANAVYWCSEQNKDYKQLMYSHRAALLTLLRSNSVLIKQKSKMTGDLDKLLACYNLFKTSLAFDLSQYRTILQSSAHLHDEKVVEMQESWIQIAQKMNAFEDLAKETKRIDAEASTLTAEVVELQRSPFSTPKQMNEMDCFEKTTKDLYSELVGSRQEHLDHSKIAEQVKRSYCEGVKNTENLYKHLRDVITCLHKLEHLLPELQQVISQIEEASELVSAMQKERQKDIWSLLSHSVSMLVMRPDKIKIGESATALNDAVPSMTIYQPSLSPSRMSMSLNSNMESLRLLDDCKVTTQMLNEAMQEMRQHQDDTVAYLTSLDLKSSS